jgi:hypothetical protein
MQYLDASTGQIIYLFYILIVFFLIMNLTLDIIADFFKKIFHSGDIKHYDKKY